MLREVRAGDLSWLRDDDDVDDEDEGVEEWQEAAGPCGSGEFRWRCELAGEAKWIAAAPLATGADCWRLTVGMLRPDESERVREASWSSWMQVWTAEDGRDGAISLANSGDPSACNDSPRLCMELACDDRR
jgi:hypothetical protein